MCQIERTIKTRAQKATGAMKIFFAGREIVLSFTPGFGPVPAPLGMETGSTVSGRAGNR
jgi:hypothetical protein